MGRVDLDIYYKHIFKDDDFVSEQFREISRAHVISSRYYDVQFGRHTLIYRDKAHKIVVPIEHALDGLCIYLESCFKNSKCDISLFVLQEKISRALAFLKVKHQFE